MAKKSPYLHSIERAVELVGSQTELAARLSTEMGRVVRQQHVWNWLHRDEKAPPEFCRAIEAATQGAVTRYQLRPDVFGEAADKEAAA